MLNLTENQTVLVGGVPKTLQCGFRSLLGKGCRETRLPDIQIPHKLGKDVHNMDSLSNSERNQGGRRFNLRRKFLNIQIFKVVFLESAPSRSIYTLGVFSNDISNSYYNNYLYN